MKQWQLWEGEPPLWPAGDDLQYPYVEVDETAATEQPFVLVAPGGGYRWLAPHEGHPIADYFRIAGFGAAVLSYRIATEQTSQPLGKGPLLDAQRAIRIIRREHGANRRVILVGFSAGGHVSTCAGVHHRPLAEHPEDGLAKYSTRPDALILCYALISASNKVERRSIDTLCGLQDQLGLHAFFRLEENAGPETPPCFLVHTGDDPTVPVANSLIFSQTLSRLKVPYSLHIFPHGPHGIGLANDQPLASLWPELATAWLHSLNL